MQLEVPSELPGPPDLLVLWAEVGQIPEKYRYSPPHLRVVGKPERLEQNPVSLEQVFGLKVLIVHGD
jgi:hypothetical protein